MHDTCIKYQQMIISHMTHAFYIGHVVEYSNTPRSNTLKIFKHNHDKQPTLRYSPRPNTLHAPLGLLIC